MEYAIFPMRVINISQRHNGFTSHGWDGSGVGCKAIDLGGANSSGSGIREALYAPTTMKVLWVDKPSNIVAFGTCDKNGNKAKVKCEDGVERVLTFAFIHMDDSKFNELEIKVGKIFASGQLCYYEGKKANGNAEGAQLHVHIEVANGWADSKTVSRESTNPMHTIIKPVTRFKNSISLYPHQIFFGLKGWNVVGSGSGLNGYTMAIVDDRKVYEVPNVGVKDEITGLYLHATKTGFRVRSTPVTGVQRKLVVRGQQAQIIELIGIQSDGYQWCKVRYNEVVGYSQMDLKNYYTVVKIGYLNKNIHLHATKMAFNIRQGTNTNSRILKTIARGQKAIIWEYLGIQSDGYQWCKVEHYGIVGYAQMDLKNCYMLTE